MKPRLLLAVSLSMFLAAASTGCDKKEGGDKTEDKSGEAKKSGGGGTCDQYAKCCMAYADALGKVQGVPESAVKAQKDACKQVDQWKGTPAAETSCKSAMDGMKQASEAYKAMPGFKWPDECK